MTKKTSKRRKTNPTNTLINQLSNLRCIKYSNTKVALTQATAIAMATANLPASTHVTKMVMVVKKSRITSIIP